MKITAQQIRYLLLASLLTTATAINAQTTGTEPTDSLAEERPFAVNMFLGAQMKINLMLTIYRPKRVSITLRDARNTVLYRENMKRDSRGYWRKFDFEESGPGVYLFEISDGRQTVTHRIVVVDVPAIAPQRYIAYGPQLSR